MLYLLGIFQSVTEAFQPIYRIGVCQKLNFVLLDKLL